jgi:hypothetical protein
MKQKVTREHTKKITWQINGKANDVNSADENKNVKHPD